MNDRVVDQAAAHATPTDLAVRDWLLVGLSFTTGIYEAICFLTFGKVFTAAQTGNLVLLGIGVAGTRQPAGPNPVTVVISLAAFAAGAALAIVGSPCAESRFDPLGLPDFLLKTPRPPTPIRRQLCVPKTLFELMP